MAKHTMYNQPRPYNSEKNLDTESVREDVKEIRSIISETLNVRRLPTKESPVDFRINKGVEVFVDSNLGDWLEVRLVKDPSKKGYVMAAYTEASNGRNFR